MKPIFAATAIAMALTAPAFAQQAGDITVGVGIGSVQPKSNPGTLAGGTLQSDVGNSTRPTLTLEYFVRDNLGVEVLAATPFRHDVILNGTKAGTVKHLPPTVSLNWHFETNSPFKPFVGLGVNLTSFFHEKTEGPLAGANLDLKHSWGLAASLGADYWLNEKSALRANLRWIDIDSDVYVNGTKVGTVNIDPWVVNAAYVMKF